MVVSLQHLSPFRLLSSPLRAAAQLQRHARLPFTTSAARLAEGDASADPMDLMGLGRILRSAEKQREDTALSEQGNADAFSASGRKPRLRIRKFKTGRGQASFLKPRDFKLDAVQTQKKRFHKPYAVGPDRADAERLDIFHQLEMDPLAECMNSSLLSYFVTDMGRMKTRAETNLTWRNQRRLGKAIRRAKKMGIIPFFSKRPLDYKFNFSGRMGQ